MEGWAGNRQKNTLGRDLQVARALGSHDEVGNNSVLAGELSPVAPSEGITPGGGRPAKAAAFYLGHAGHATSRRYRRHPYLHPDDQGGATEEAPLAFYGSPALNLVTEYASMLSPEGRCAIFSPLS